MRSRPWTFARQSTALSGLQQWIGRIPFYSTQGILCIEADCQVRGKAILPGKQILLQDRRCETLTVGTARIEPEREIRRATVRHNGKLTADLLSRFQ
jgi:hypothetical protein